MQIYERLLSLGLVLGLVAGLGWSIGPPSSGMAVQLPAAPARIVPSVAATSPSARPQFLLATLTPTRTPTPINIGNFVWNDLNGNGIQGAGEPGLAGIQVQLWNAAKTQLIDIATTNSNGNYTVVAPVPGDYRIRVILPGAGYTFTLKDQGGDDLLDSDINWIGSDTGFSDIFTLASNVISITTKDAGIRLPPGSPTPTRTPTPINIGNFVWNDLNGNGVQNAGEPGLVGITVQLWNAAKTDLIDSAVTNASGSYAVTAPVPGDYRIRVLLPAGAIFTLKDQGGDNQLDSDINPSGADSGFTDIFNLANNVISTTIMDAGIRPPPGSPTPTRTPTPINIGNFVWNDLNSNGVQNAGEPGLNGITVQLWNAAKTQLLDSAVTNSNGGYSVVAPLPGDYRIRVLAPTGAIFTLKDQGGDDLLDSDINWIGDDTGFSDAFTLASNVISITRMDAGLRNVPATPTMTATSTRTATPVPGPEKAFLPLLIK
jgi:hypothetical protein